MGRRRGCLIAGGGTLGLILVCCLVMWFVAIPNIQSSFGDLIGDELATQVAEQVGVEDIEPGTYSISVSALEEELEQTLGENQFDSVNLSVTEQQITLSMVVEGQSIDYSGNVTAQDGELVIEDMEASEGVFEFVLPGDTMGGAIEDGVNSYFAERNLEIASVELGDDEIVVEAVPTGEA